MLDGKDNVVNILFRILISYTSYRMEVTGITTIFFEVFSEIKNEIVNGAGSGINIIAPNGLQYFFAGHDFVLVFDQQFQKHRFFLTQLYFLSCFGKRLLCFEIDAAISEGVSVAD